MCSTVRHNKPIHKHGIGVQVLVLSAGLSKKDDCSGVTKDLWGDDLGQEEWQVFGPALHMAPNFRRKTILSSAD